MKMTKPSSLQEAIAGLPKEQADEMLKLAEELGEEFMLKHWRMMKASRDFLESLWCDEVASLTSRRHRPKLPGLQSPQAASSHKPSAPN